MTMSKYSHEKKGFSIPGADFTCLHGGCGGKRVGGAGIHRGMFDKDFQGFCLKSMIFRQKIMIFGCFLYFL